MYVVWVIQNSKISLYEKAKKKKKEEIGNTL